MTRAFSIALALSIGALAAYGCDEEETPEDKLLSDLDQYEIDKNEQLDVVCDCWDEFMFGTVKYNSKAECKTGQGEILPARRRCIDDAFRQDIDVAQQWLNCVLPLEAEATTCFNTKLTCSDATSITACSNDYDVGYDKCLTLPNSVLRDFEDCYK